MPVALRGHLDNGGRLTRSAAQVGTQWLVSCRTYTASGKLLKAWGPAVTAADTTCPAAAAPVPVTDYAYDDLDRPIRVTENLTAAEGGNRVSETVYNLDDTVQSAKRAVGSAIAQTYATYTYTNNGLVATVKDAKNNLTAHSYDGHDRKLKTQFPNPTTVNTASTTDYEQYGYDANANLTTLRKRSGTTITLAYDNLNRLLSRTYPVVADNVSYSYDLLGRRLTATGASTLDNVSYAYDNAGRMSSTVAAGRTIGYQYDAASNRTRMTWPDAFYVTTDYDALNRPTVLKEAGTTALVTYAYDDLSRRTTATRGNGTSTSFGYDTQSNLSALSHDLAGTTQDVAYTYARNQAGEITTHNWSNDLYRWAGITGTATNGTRSYTANGLNQYTAAAGGTVTHDTNGNIAGDGTWTFTYDQNNRLKTAVKTGTSVALAYDAEGRLRQHGAGTNKLYDGHELVAEYTTATTGTVRRRWVHGPGIDEPIAYYQYPTSTSTIKAWLIADHQGSVVAELNTAGAHLLSGTYTATYSYGPFGEPNLNEGRFRYTGQQRLDGTEFHYYKARIYYPKLGRFLQTDPIGTADDLNLYAYVGNNPVNRTDPTGLMRSPNAGMGGGSWSGSGASGSSGIGGTGGELMGGEPSQGSVQVAQAMPLPLYLNPWTAGPAVVATCLVSSGCRNLIFNQGATVPANVGPGPNAGESVPAGPSPTPTKEQQGQINDIGDRSGCHNCGSSDPGTKSGDWIGDHQPPTKLNPPGGPQSYFPHCKDCSNQQGGRLRWLPRP